MHEISWFEVMGTDLEATKAFYGAVFGWTFQPPPGDMPYAMVRGEGNVGGGVGVAPAPWSTFYVHVDDLDGTLAKAQAAGATVLMPPHAIPQGRIAVFADPDGNPIGLRASA